MLGAIIQARLSSSRLPGKVLMDISGKPLIWHIINRLKPCNYISEVILATTTNPADDDLVRWAESNNVIVFRGSEEDVLSRFYHAGELLKSDDILRVTADDPFKDAGVIEDVYKMYLSAQLDFAYNNKPPTFPEGLDVEIFSKPALKKAFEESIDPFEREHVTQYFYRNSRLFKQKNFSFAKDISYLRWTIDTDRDLLMARSVYQSLYKEGEVFSFSEILNFIDQNPGIANINRDVPRSAMYIKEK